MTDWDTIQDSELDDHLAMAQGLAEQDEDWTDFLEEVTTERDRRAEVAKAAEAQRRRRERAKYDASPEGKLAALRKDLKDAEQALAESDTSPTPLRVHPDQVLDGDPITAARYAAARTVADLKAQIAVAEARLPFAKTSDDQLLDLAADAETILTPLREAVAKADAQVAETGIADTSFATQKARRDLMTAEAEFGPVTDEMAYRKRDATNAIFVHDREVRVAMKTREESLVRWKAEEARLMSILNDRDKSGRVDLADLRAAQRAVDMLEKAKGNNTPLEEDELKAAREKIAADTSIRVVGNAVEATW